MAKHVTHWTFAVLLCMAFMFSGCQFSPPPPPTELDTPIHHVVTGNKFIHFGKLMDAKREFLRAQELDPSYATAYLGMGLVAALEGDCQSGLGHMQQAEGLSADKSEMVNINIGFIRLYTACQGSVDPEWLSKAEARYNAAYKASPWNPAPPYFMGQAYKAGNELSKAEEMFSVVVNLNQSYAYQAKEEIVRIQEMTD